MTHKIMTEKWVSRFTKIVSEVRTWSKDPSTKVGSVIVSPSMKIISTGFNGLPSEMEDTDEILNNRDLKLANIIHAEHNAIIQADPTKLEGSTMFVSHFPCPSCAEKIVECGISTVVVTPDNGDNYATRWAELISRSREILDKKKVSIVELN
jgi:dCMP deaminase